MKTPRPAKFNSITLTNFKGYRGTHKIPLKPLTILVGSNSAGKSSLMKSILTMSQVAQKQRKLNDLSLELHGKLAKCGTYDETLNDNSEKNFFSIKYGVNLESALLQEARNESKRNDIKSFHEEKFPGADYEVEFKFGKHPDSNLLANFLGLNIDFGEFNLIKTQGIYSTNTDAQKRKDFARAREYISSGRPLKNVRITTEVVFPDTEDLWDDDDKEAMERQDDIVKRLEKEPNPAVKMDPDFQFYCFAGQGFPWWIHANNFVLRKNIGWANNISAFVTRTVSQIIYLGPLREEHSRESKIASSSSNRIGIKGEKLPGMLHSRNENKEIMNKFHSHLSNMGIADKIITRETMVERNGEMSPSGFIRMYVEDCNGNERHISDMGTGVGQVAPIVFECILRRNRLILIEQPEVHLHPKAQSELGDLFIDSLEEGNQLIVETHSSTMIERIRRRIREGEISHNDVNIIYLKSSKKGTEVIPIGFESDGDFDSPWPEDTFFGEREKEIFGW